MGANRLLHGWGLPSYGLIDSGTEPPTVISATEYDSDRLNGPPHNFGRSRMINQESFPYLRS